MSSKPWQFDQQYSRDDLLDPIREFADEHGRAPTTQEYQEYATPSAKTVYDRVGAWDVALREAGCDPETKPNGPYEREYTDEECLEWIRSFVDHFGVVPTSDDLYGWPGPSRIIYERRWESWGEMIREAGFEPRGATDGGRDE